MKRIVVCLFLITVVPLASPTRGRSTGSAPLAAVALAGHTTSGGFCECGSPGCICDPGEVPPIGNAAVPAGTAPADGSVDQGPAPDIDPTPGMLLIALAFLLWFKMR